LHIVVGEARPQPKPSPGEPNVTADQIRAQADALRRAGQNAEAKKLYQRAIELYQREAQADPQARAVKQAGMESCRRALEQCQ
jgi:predicted NBD/HSP70 family sugar kinase